MQQWYYCHWLAYLLTHSALLLSDQSVFLWYIIMHQLQHICGHDYDFMGLLTPVVLILVFCFLLRLSII